MKSDTEITADGNGSSWDDNDPSVFNMTIGSSLQGEYQLTNGYGPDKAPQVMKVRVNLRKGETRITILEFLIDLIHLCLILGSLEHLHHRGGFQLHVTKWHQCCENPSWVVDYVRSQSTEAFHRRLIGGLRQCFQME